MSQEFAVANPLLRGLLSAIVFFTAIAICILFFEVGITVALSATSMILASAGLSSGIQKSIIVENGFLIVQYLIGTTKYPLKDIKEIRHEESSFGMNPLKPKNRVDVITRSNRPISLYPLHPEKLIYFLQQNK